MTKIKLSQDEYNRLVSLARANANQIEQRAVEYNKKNGACSIHIIGENMNINKKMCGMTEAEVHSCLIRMIADKIRQHHADREYCRIDYHGDRPVFGFYRALLPSIESNGRLLEPTVLMGKIDSVCVNGNSIVMEMIDKGIVLPGDVNVTDLLSIYRHIKTDECE